MTGTDRKSKVVKYNKIAIDAVTSQDHSTGKANTGIEKPQRIPKKVHFLLTVRH